MSAWRLGYRHCGQAALVISSSSSPQVTSGSKNCGLRVLSARIFCPWASLGSGQTPLLGKCPCDRPPPHIPSVDTVLPGKASVLYSVSAAWRNDLLPLSRLLFRCIRVSLCLSESENNIPELPSSQEFFQETNWLMCHSNTRLGPNHQGGPFRTQGGTCRIPLWSQAGWFDPDAIAKQ